MDYASFYESLQYHLNKKGHGGQAMICRHTDIPRSYLSRIVKRHRNAGARTQRKIARYFGFEIDEFIEFGRRLTLGENPEISTDFLKAMPGQQLMQRLTEAVRQEISTSQLLSHSQLLYENIVENSRQIIVRFDEKLQLSFANRACELLTGLDRTKLITLDLRYLINEKYHAELMENINNCQANGGTFSMEATDNVNQHWLFLTVTIFPEGVGGKDKGQLVGFDNTEQKLLLDKLRFIQHGVEMSYVPTLWIDEAANIVYVNQAVPKLLGYSKEELETMHVWDINPLITKEKWQEKWDWFQTKERIDFVGQYKAKDGSIIPVEFQVSNLKYPDGRKYNVVFVKPTV